MWLILSVLVVAACSSQPDIDIEATIEARVALTSTSIYETKSESAVSENGAPTDKKTSLVLELHSSTDHNGAFYRDSNLTEEINTPTLVPTLIPTLTPIPVPTAIPTLAPTLNPTPVPSIPTPMPTQTPTPTPTPTVTKTATPLPTHTVTVIPTQVSATIATPTSATIPQSEPISKPVLILPFTSEHVPWEILPMGETTLHPPWPGEKPWGHPGIDFIWHHKAPIVAALDGEVLHIITEEDPGIPGVIWYTVQVMTGEFVVNYNVTEFESISPSLKVGSKVVAGQTLGYPNPITAADVDVGIHSMHWEFGTWEKVSDPKPNPSGVIEHYRTTRICPVQYFSDSEMERLTAIWEAAQYNEKDKN